MEQYTEGMLREAIREAQMQYGVPGVSYHPDPSSPVFFLPPQNGAEPKSVNPSVDYVWLIPIVMLCVGILCWLFLPHKIFGF